MAPPVWVVGQVLSAADVNNWLVPSAAIKPSDQTVTNSTTMVNDNDLVVAALANASYYFWCFLDFEGPNASSDIKWQWTVPASAVLRYHAVYSSAGAVATVGVTYKNTDVVNSQTTGGTNLRGVTMHGTFVMSATPGNLQLQWAQNTANVNPTTLHAQSALMLQRIS